MTSVRSYGKLIEQGQYDKVIQLLTPKIEENPLNPDFWELLALSYYHKKDAIKALEIVEKGFSYNSGSKLLLERSIFYSFNSDNYAKAVEIGKKYESIGKKNYFILDLLAYSCDRAGDPEKALQTYKESMKISLDFASNIIQQIYLHLNNKEYIDAIIKAKKFVLLHPDKVYIWYMLGYSYAKNKEHEESIKVTKYAQSIDKDKIENGHFLGYAYIKAGKFDEGIDLIKKSLEVAPDLRWAWEHLAKANLKLGNYDEVIRITDNMIKDLNEAERPKNYSKAQLKDVKAQLNQKTLKIKNKAIKLKNQQQKQ